MITSVNVYSPYFLTSLPTPSRYSHIMAWLAPVKTKLLFLLLLTLALTTYTPFYCSNISLFYLMRLGPWNGKCFINSIRIRMSERRPTDCDHESREDYEGCEGPMLSNPSMESKEDANAAHDLATGKKREETGQASSSSKMAGTESSTSTSTSTSTSSSSSSPPSSTTAYVYFLLD